VPRRRASKLQPDGQGDQLLLRAVVQVALQAPTLLVLSRDQPLARRAEILDQLGVREHESGFPARSVTSFSSTGDSGSLSGFITVSRPGTSP
jgi:hypothetical protein